MNQHVRPPIAWPPDYVKLFAWRVAQLQRFRERPELIPAAYAYYKTHPVEFICDWMDTFDPRNAGQEGKMVRMPFILFPKQKELVQFIHACLLGEGPGLIEKCRDAGATWVCVGMSVWLWIFWDGVAVGWGSRKADLVDKLGVMDSIFEKIRAVIGGLPKIFIPEGFNRKEHLTYMRCINPANGSTITGESGDEIGRGGRTRIYFKDESAHYERPELIEASLGDNTRVQIDISSVNGLGNVFARKRKAGVVWEPGSKIEKFRTNVFIFDWRDHPEKDDDWYNQRRKKAEDEGLLAKFAQEVDRDYAASVEGVIIPKAWIISAVDAHLKLGFTDDGGRMAGLDVADGGGDQSALVQRKGVVCRAAESWGDPDVGKTARRAIQNLLDPDTILEYDCVGIGAGVKSEFNRLGEEGLLPSGLRIVPWDAGAGVLFPDENIIRFDRQSPTNKDHYHNLKAQAWWKVREKFWKTHRAVTEGVEYETDELISIDGTLPNLNQLIDELSQATSSLSTSRLKLLVDKTPDGTRSPNLADAFVMCYWPVKTTRYALDNV